jgi:hydrogenase nickel incorporation protein HypA/HybF
VHELSLCGAIADIVTRRADGRPVEAVHLRIGQLRQVVPDTLEFCWSMVIADTALDGARLEVERIPAVVRCGQCGAEAPTDAPALACGACGGLDVDVVSGDEFVVTALDLTAV